MSTSTLIAIYFLIWWVTLFAILPWGVRNQEESGDVIPGSDPGAPATHRVWQKLVGRPWSQRSFSEFCIRSIRAILFPTTS